MTRQSKISIAAVAAVILATVAVGCSKTELPSAEAPVPSAISLEKTATTFVDYLAGGQYGQAVESFDETMAGLMTASALEEAWDSVIAQAGEFEDIVGTRTARQNEYDLVFVTCRFANTTLDIQLTFDDMQQVAGLFFLPATEAYHPPQYADTDRFSEEEVVVGEGVWQLPATLTMPKGEGPFPAVVLVHGSGPNDRDETVGATKPFKDLAWGLATNGVAVLRYEKRTKEYPAEMLATVETLTVKEETTDDVVAAVDLLSNLEGIDGSRVFVLGHSLGGMLAPRLAILESRLAGLIILAGPTRGLEDLMLEQITYIASLDGEIDANEEAQLQEIRRQVNQVKELDIDIDEYVLGVSRSYWQDLAGYNPAVTAQSLTLPILVLQGERDYQVTMEDFEGWRDALQGKDNATLKSYPDLNHLFITGTAQSTPEEYSASGNVAPIVIDDIAAWIADQD